METDNHEEQLQTPAASAHAGYSRRRFLQVAGAFAGAGMLVTSSCEKDEGTGIGGVDLGSGDIGILNYAYALEQLEAAFYTQVLLTPYSGITAAETSLLTDIRDHEIAHREFLKTVLAGNAIKDLQVNFSLVVFTNRESVLTTARTLEDLGVAAYNGAGKLIKSPDNLLLAGKIVSVEARHAAAISELLAPNTFANGRVVDGYSMEKSKDPGVVLIEVAKYFNSVINGTNLPTS